MACELFVASEGVSEGWFRELCHDFDMVYNLCVVVVGFHSKYVKEFSPRIFE